MKKLKTVLQSKYFYLILLLITFIYCFVILKFNIYKTEYSEKNNVLIGTITNIKKGDYNTLEVKGKENLLVYDYNSKVNYQIGDLVKIKGSFSLANHNTNFYLFDYNNYLKSKKIYFTVTADYIEVIKKNNNIFYKIKNNIINHINKIDNPYLNAFILGDTSKINTNVLNSYQSNGVSHLFAVSGMHVSLITLVLSKVLKVILKNNKVNYIVIFFFLIFYVFLTNYSKSVIRASFFYILLSINKCLNFNISSKYIFILLISIVLILNPYNLYNIAFLFSYTITFFLILFGNIINKHKSYFFKLFLTSFIAFVAGLPILINSYFNINLLTIFLNIIFVPFVSFIIFPLSVLTFFLPVLDKLFDIFIILLENLSLFCQKIKLFNLTMCHINSIVFIFYYIIIILILYGFTKRKYHYIIFLILLIIIHNNYRYLNPNYYFIMLDVKQGDSSLIIFPNNKGNILIDTGGIYGNDNMAKNTLLPILKSNGINKIDYLIITHGDYDHMGEAINLVNNFNIEKVILNRGDYNNLESGLINVLEEKKITYYQNIKQLNIDNNKLYFLNNGLYDNENDNSNVIYTNLNNYKFLLMGDAGIEVEEDLIRKYNLQYIDVLKVGHHGSKTGSSEEFINSINPKYSIISVGKNNRYGHPNNEILNNLEDSKIYRTDQDGSIMFKIKKNKLEIETCMP